jgi:predicted amidohydrolase YtcJ
MKRSNPTLSILALVALLLFSACTEIKKTAHGPEADLVFTNANIITLDAGNPGAEALAVKGDRILAVGSAAEITETIGKKTRIVDLGGRTVVPGLIESHAHLLGMGRAKMVLDLVGTESAAQIAKMVGDHAAKLPPRRWILGRGWDQNDWETKAFPTHAALSAAAPDHPVCLTRVDGHALWANGKALALAGVTAATADPPGGRIERDGQGAPSGVFVDNAMSLIRSHIPEPTRREKKEALLLAVKECNAFGFTSFHDAGQGSETITLYRELLAEGKLTLRCNVMLSGGNADLLDELLPAGPSIGEGDGFLTIRSIKLFADGALGSRGAALLEDYADDPGNRGLLVDDGQRIFTVACRALEHGFQVCTHAIGDRANRVVLDAYERAFKTHPTGKDHRFRIEHAQILDGTDIERFAALGVIASMQAQHCTSDMPWVPDRIGDTRTAEGAYVWKKLLDRGVHVPNGSDAPVESANPFWGIYAAITRRDRNGNPAGGWYPDQAMTRKEALESFTVEGAFASFDEELKGRLKKGMLADITVLSKNIMAVAEEEIPGIEATMTVIGGKVVFSRMDG